VAFYIPLGPRGLILRFGTMLIGVLGGAVYWWSSRRRCLVPIAVQEPFVVAEG
jgi:hypothetical protein